MPTPNYETISVAGHLAVNLCPMADFEDKDKQLIGLLDDCR